MRFVPPVSASESEAKRLTPKIESRPLRLTASVLGSLLLRLQRLAWAALQAHTGEQQHTVYLRSNLHLWNHPLSHNRLRTEPISEQECNLKVGDATLLKVLGDFIFFCLSTPLRVSTLHKLFYLFFFQLLYFSVT